MNLRHTLPFSAAYGGGIVGARQGGFMVLPKPAAGSA